MKTKEVKKESEVVEENGINERVIKLNALGVFKIIPEVKLGDKTKEVLQTINKCGVSISFLSLCRALDCKPSKLDKKITILVSEGLVKVKDDVITITEKGQTIADETNTQIKNNRRFVNFINALDENEFEEFYQKCSNVKSNIKNENLEDYVPFKEANDEIMKLLDPESK